MHTHAYQLSSQFPDKPKLYGCPLIPVGVITAKFLYGTNALRDTKGHHLVDLYFRFPHPLIHYHIPYTSFPMILPRVLVIIPTCNNFNRCMSNFCVCAEANVTGSVTVVNFR